MTILLTVNSTFKLFRQINQDALAAIENQLKLKIMEMYYPTEWQCGLALFQGWLIQQLRYLNNSPNSVSILYTVMLLFLIVKE